MVWYCILVSQQYMILPLHHIQAWHPHKLKMIFPGNLLSSLFDAVWSFQLVRTANLHLRKKLHQFSDTVENGWMWIYQYISNADVLPNLENYMAVPLLIMQSVASMEEKDHITIRMSKWLRWVTYFPSCHSSHYSRALRCCSGNKGETRIRADSHGAA